MISCYCVGASVLLLWLSLMMVSNPSETYLLGDETGLCFPPHICVLRSVCPVCCFPPRVFSTTTHQLHFLLKTAPDIVLKRFTGIFVLIQTLPTPWV